MNSITSELRSLLLEKGVECSAVMQREEQNQELVMKNSRLCSAATTTVTRVEIRICCSGLYAKKEYTLGADADLSQIATDIISELSERESVFNESPEKDNAAIYEICGEPSTAAMVNTLKKLDHDAKHLGLIIPRAALTYTSISAELENEIGTRIASRQNGYSISYSAFLERDGKTVTPIKVRKTFKILEQFPEIPYSSVLVKNRELLFSKTQIKRFTGSLIIAPGTLYYMMLDFLFEQLFEDAIATGSSDWANCMGKQVLPPNFSAYMQSRTPATHSRDSLLQYNPYSKPNYELTHLCHRLENQLAVSRSLYNLPVFA